MKTHFTKYDGGEEKKQLRDLCFDKNEADLNGISNNCVRLTNDHLIYVNGISLDSLLPAGKVKLGDYLYHTGLNKYVEITEIKDNIFDYYRNVITENGNIVINNGFYSGATLSAQNNSNYGLIHNRMVFISNLFYRIFSLNDYISYQLNAIIFYHLIDKYF